MILWGLLRFIRFSFSTTDIQVSVTMPTVIHHKKLCMHVHPQTHTHRYSRSKVFHKLFHDYTDFVRSTSRPKQLFVYQFLDPCYAKFMKKTNSVTF